MTREYMDIENEAASGHGRTASNGALRRRPSNQMKIAAKALCVLALVLQPAGALADVIDNGSRGSKDGSRAAGIHLPDRRETFAQPVTYPRLPLEPFPDGQPSWAISGSSADPALPGQRPVWLPDLSRPGRRPDLSEI